MLKSDLHDDDHSEVSAIDVQDELEMKIFDKLVKEAKSLEYSTLDCILSMTEYNINKGMPERSLKWFKRAAIEFHDIDSYFQYATILISIQKSVTQAALDHLKYAAKNGHSEACSLYGSYLESGVQSVDGLVLVKVDFQEALLVYKTEDMDASDTTPEYQLQHPNSQYRISMILKNGYGGIEIDKAESKKWIFKAAANGHIKAFYSIGMRHLNEVTESTTFTMLRGLQMIQFTADRLLLEDSVDFESAFRKDLQASCVLPLLMNQSLMKNVERLENMDPLESENTGNEIFYIALVFAYSLNLKISEYVFLFELAAANGSIDAAFEYARHLEYYNNDTWFQGDEEEQIRKYVSYYYYAAKRGHLMALASLARLYPDIIEYQSTLYELLCKEQYETELLAPFLKCLPSPDPSEDLDSIIERELSNILTAWNNNEKKKVGCCCVQ
ncbi:hypothetical protein BC833DRAFT_575796 [Globomyces pollinis-pini]|nr:hypothetical protein BC833DRAFT_575796 [Globomyces pollinis-pini]KAJ2995569.1 hypothetical protein HDV02_000628 [Globomyces sp. JEL0801]